MGKTSKAISNAVKQKTPKNKKQKTILVFDESARRDYLTGFSRRKEERKKKAQEQILEELKEEKKQIRLNRRQELNEKWEKLNIQLDFDKIVKPKVYDLKQHTVTVTDVSDVDFASQGAFKLGTNQGLNQEDDKTNGSASDTADSDAETSKGEGSKKKKRKSKPHKNLTHLMSKTKQAKKRRKQKQSLKLPSHIRTNADRPSKSKPKRTKR